MIKKIQHGEYLSIPTTRKKTYSTNHTYLLIPHIRTSLDNSRSTRNKIHMIIEFHIDYNIDILIIT